MNNYIHTHTHIYLFIDNIYTLKLYIVNKKNSI